MNKNNLKAPTSYIPPTSVEELIRRYSDGERYFVGASLQKAMLRNTTLRDVNLTEAMLYGADLSGANLGGSILDRANLREASCFGTQLSSSQIIEADLYDCRLCDAHLNNCNLRKTSFWCADLDGANLSDSDLSGAYLRFADLTNSSFQRANLSEANLIGAQLVNSDLDGADISRARVYGASAWSVSLEGTIQRDLIITDENDPIVTVDDLEVAQFVHLILRNHNLRKVINTVTNRGVLILGRFGGGGIEILRALGESLRENGYLPIIFEFSRPDNRTYTETIRTLAGLSRFVIADLSGPSIPQELYAIVPHLKIPLVPILESGKRSYSMFVDLMEYEWVLSPIIRFDTINSLLSALPDEIIAPAELHVEKRSEKLRELFED